GVPVRVADVASVQIGDIPRQGVAGEDDDDDVVSGHVLMRKGENPSVVLAALKQRIAELKKESLPPGVEVRVFYDRSWLIERTLKTVFTNLLEGALLVCMVLYLFLNNMRAAAIVAAVIPLALLATFIGLQMVGIPANLLSLGAMDFGIIIDGAVIIVEHIFSRLTTLPDNVDRRTRLSAVLNATIEVGRPTLFSMLIIIAAHIPIFTLQRHEGRIFAPMAWSVTSALVGSLIVSLTLVPLMCLWLLRGKLPHGENRLMKVLHVLYAPALQWALARRGPVLLIAGLALAASIAVIPKLGSEFLPELNEGSVWVNVAMESSVSIGEAQHMSQRLRDAMRTVPEVRSTYSELGRPEDGTDPKIASQIEVLVDLYPEDEWTRNLTKRQVLAELDLAVQTLPGIQVSFSQPIRDNVLESISQVDGQIVIKVTGDDLDKMHAYGTQILNQIRGVQGVTRAFIDRDGQLPQYRVVIDRARASRHGLKVGEIEAVIETAMAGKIVSHLWEGERRFPIVVRLGDPARELARISEIQVPTPSGAFVSLSDVATFQSASGAMNIGRENGRRVLSVGVFIRDRDMGSVVADMRERVDKVVKLDEGYTMAWAGEFENQERAMARLSWVVPLSILIIFLFLFDAFSSLKSALLIIANIPFAMIGGIFALLLTGIPLSVSAAIGFIALFGQAVLNGVVMLSYFGQLRERGETIYEAVRKGSLERLRTVLMTGLLAMLGLLPMALSSAIGSETQKPLAVVVIGGLISATFLTLFVLPTLYLWVNESRASRAARG
ncbi:MAG: efflux RND transporter permease subunit, partial [Burkholderiales bacterium]